MISKKIVREFEMFLTRFFKYMTGPGSRGEQNRIKSLISMKRARQRPGLVVNITFFHHWMTYYFVENKGLLCLDTWMHTDSSRGISNNSDYTPPKGTSGFDYGWRKRRLYKTTGLFQGNTVFPLLLKFSLESLTWLFTFRTGNTSGSTWLEETLKPPTKVQTTRVTNQTNCGDSVRTKLKKCKGPYSCGVAVNCPEKRGPWNLGQIYLFITRKMKNSTSAFEKLVP